MSSTVNSCCMRLLHILYLVPGVYVCPLLMQYLVPVRRYSYLTACLGERNN